MYLKQTHLLIKRSCTWICISLSLNLNSKHLTLSQASYNNTQRYENCEKMKPKRKIFDTGKYSQKQCTFINDICTWAQGVLTILGPFLYILVLQTKIQQKISSQPEASQKTAGLYWLPLATKCTVEGKRIHYYVNNPYVFVLLRDHHEQHRSIS